MGTTPTLVTVQEFLALPELEEKRVELIGGEIVEMRHGDRPHEFVKSNINRLLIAWLLLKRPGRVLVETGFRIDKYNFLIPDLSYISKDPPKRGSKGPLEMAPDLAIEVVSSEPAARLSKKIGLYLSHGSKSVWAIYPEERKISIHALGGSGEFQHHQILEDPVLPGFSAPVAAIFEGI
ncbi:MAG TPA: Uma2 family endonuclease [Bryobacteraceae bacterium]